MLPFNVSTKPVRGYRQYRVCLRAVPLFKVNPRLVDLATEGFLSGKPPYPGTTGDKVSGWKYVLYPNENYQDALSGKAAECVCGGFPSAEWYDRKHRRCRTWDEYRGYVTTQDSCSQCDRRLREGGVVHAMDTVPHPDCTCGYYAYSGQPKDVYELTGAHVGNYKDGGCWAAVEGYGTVIRHTLGWRSQHLRILGVVPILPMHKGEVVSVPDSYWQGVPVYPSLEALMSDFPPEVR